jgi:predicted lipid-binding transport protein (Tim44 family)
MILLQTSERDDSTTDSQHTDAATLGNGDPQATATASATENVSQERAGGAGSGSNIGDFIAVGLGVLILLIAVLVVAGVIAYRMRIFRRRKKGKISRFLTQNGLI